MTRTGMCIRAQSDYLGSESGEMGTSVISPRTLDYHRSPLGSTPVGSSGVTSLILILIVFLVYSVAIYPLACETVRFLSPYTGKAALGQLFAYGCTGSLVREPPFWWRSGSHLPGTALMRAHPFMCVQDSSYPSRCHASSTPDLVHRRQQSCFIQKALISHRISQQKQSPLLSYRLSLPTTTNHFTSLRCPPLPPPIRPRPSPRSAMVVNLTRSPTLWTKVGAAFRRSQQRGPRHLTPYLYPTVNVQMLKLWDDESEFDAGTDKAQFRQYEDACDRVKNFYKEQHGMISCLTVCGAAISPSSRGNHYRKSDCCIQHPGSSQLQEPPPCPHGHLGGHGDAQHPCGRVRPRCEPP